MLITYHGHSEFYLESASGFALLTDPFDAHVGYPMRRCRADAVTISHQHSDHNDVSKALGAPAIIDAPGVWPLGEDAQITAIPAFHDDAQGAKRGKNLLMKIELEGLTLAHLGDLGAPLDEAQCKALGKIDILMLPVGGYYTIDAEIAAQTAAALRPRIVIPMHYKTAVNPDWPIAGPEEFLRRMGAENTAPMPLLRVTKADLSQQAALALLEWER